MARGRSGKFLHHGVVAMGIALLCSCAGMTPPEKPMEPARVIVPTIPSVTSAIEVYNHLPDRIDQSNWLFVQVDTQPVVAPASLSLEQGKLSGNTGCNLLSGSYQRQDSALRFSSIAMTRMYCHDTAAQESRVTTALNNTRYAMIVKANGYLVLLDENRKILAELMADTH